MTITLFEPETRPIPEHWTWSGSETGRPWSTVGDQVTLTVYVWIPPWEQLAEWLAVEFEPQGWTVYGVPPDNFAVPCVVVDMQDDWQAPTLFNTPGWAFDVHLIVPRARGAEAVDRLGKACAFLRAAIRPSSFEWLIVSAPETSAMAGKDFLEVTVGVAIMQPDPDPIYERI